jgi:hypothetical protein
VGCLHLGSSSFEEIVNLENAYDLWRAKQKTVTPKVDATRPQCLRDGGDSAPIGRSRAPYAHPRTEMFVSHLQRELRFNVGGVGSRLEPMIALVLFVVVLSALIMILVFIPRHH